VIFCCFQARKHATFRFFSGNEKKSENQRFRGILIYTEL
jgi:hypothetical protein